jgi:hypothetical protein
MQIVKSSEASRYWDFILIEKWGNDVDAKANLFR